jgi:acetyl-CoA C-acetyltransferase
MNKVAVVAAARTPVGRRRGGLSGMHAAGLLGAVQKTIFERSGVDPASVRQVVGGCVGQVGMQSMNVTRTAWLAAGLPIEVPATTVDSQCGSSQQATTLAYGLVASGVVDTALACGVELMSRVPMGATTPKDPDVGKPINRDYWAAHEYTTQFEGAERIADKWGITRADADRFGKLSQDRAADAWSSGAFDQQIVPVRVPVPDDDGKPTGEFTDFTRDEGPRPTTLEGLAKLSPAGARPNGVHTAGTSSQVSDGAAAVLLMTQARADALGLEPLATIVDTTLVGCDPVLMLEGPIPATRKLLADNHLKISDIDLVEINEAFASVVLAWARELSPDLDRVNPNGGAIALGHPLGATGAILLTKAVYELRARDAQTALVTMCCGGGLGTGTLLRRD